MKAIRPKKINWGEVNQLGSVPRIYAKLPLGYHAILTYFKDVGWNYKIKLRMTIVEEANHPELQGIKDCCQRAWDKMLLEAFEEVENEDI